ncbi:hypothetical protein KVR01_008838 [Diaporthe batatas]|uniref:uncharacterized protein n=1 Tax=Diaporthe batatas TaxID=748121 RepID=UPI001D056E24|nr:uncharacterized protein KVR01_008838 [Diaporthe batatas]KAG8161851.1 hypothetical protein KVR01_008838 [Diaporthe batatas]
MEPAGLALGLWERSVGRLEATRTKNVSSDSVDEAVNDTDPRRWGRLRPVNKFKWPGIVFTDRNVDFPKSKPHGYIVGCDSECELKDGDEITFVQPQQWDGSRKTETLQHQQTKKKAQQDSMMHQWQRMQYGSVGSDKGRGESMLELAQHLDDRGNFRAGGHGGHRQNGRSSFKPSKNFNYDSSQKDNLERSQRLFVDLIDSMLVVDPERRFTIEQCLSHPWLTLLDPGEQSFEEQASAHEPISLTSVKDTPSLPKIGPSVPETEEKKKLHMHELDGLLPPAEQDNNGLPQRQKPVTEALQESQDSSAAQPAHVDEHLRGKSPMTAHTDRMMSLEYDSFTELVSSAVKNMIPPEVLSTQIPEDLHIDMEFHDKGHNLSTWTCTPSAQVTPDQVPLRVDGHPVVLPVEYVYPLTGMFSPPPDPHPRFISPSATLSDEDIHQIISTFPACVGFYLLVNGFLQIIMPDGFDYEEGVPSLPSEFGGLKVSLIPEAVFPTAGEASKSIPTATTTSKRTALERIFGPSSSQHSTVAGPVRTTGSSSNQPANVIGVSVGCTIRAIVPGSKSKQRFEGKTGVAISPRNDLSKKYITIPTHLLTDSVIASKTTSLESNTWRENVKVCIASNSAELGKVTAVFDDEPKSFPVGFSHDVSLVDISGVSDTPRATPYATDLTWLSQQEWMDIKYNSSNLVLLDDRSRETKSIGIVDSRCQVRDEVLPFPPRSLGHTPSGMPVPFSAH